MLLCFSGAGFSDDLVAQATSTPGEIALKNFGFSAENILKKVKEIL